MPKGIGYGEAGRASKMGFFSKKKKKKKTTRTESTIKRLKEAGLTDAEIKKLLDKGAK